MTTDINTQQKYKNPSAGSVISGVVAGFTIKRSLTNDSKRIAPKLLNKMYELSRSLNADEFAEVQKAGADTIKTSGLEAKGVSVINATFKSSDEITKIIEKKFDKGFFKNLPKKVKDKKVNEQLYEFILGQNACYEHSCKKIIIPEKELGLAIFHEAGHAMNANISKVVKNLQKCYSLPSLGLPIGMIALLKTKKAPDEKPKNGFDKATTFIKNNAGKLIFATYIPILLEEGLATLKGNKFAKKLLSSPELAKKVAKSNALGYSTYLLKATASSLGIYLGTKVKDAIASKKLVTENK